jgi:hypothetical protein
VEEILAGSAGDNAGGLDKISYVYFILVVK